MARRVGDGEASASEAVQSYRYAAKRKNNPPAGLAAQGAIREVPKYEYAYDPHLPPVLRFDPTGAPDRANELLALAGQRALTVEELADLGKALETARREPWLEWTGKREQPKFTVDPVALHIHERVAAQAILRVAAR